MISRDLLVYTELDSLFDYRRGLLQWLITEEIEEGKKKEVGDNLWELHLAKNYKERRMDSFEYPFFNINRAKFKELYNQRSLKHWIMYYPSRLKDFLITSIMDVECMDSRPLNVRSMCLYINTYPYQLDDELKDQLIEHCKRNFGGLSEVKLIEEKPSTLTANYFKQYHYVYKYNLVNDEDSKYFLDSVKDCPVPDTAFIIPDVLVKDSEQLNKDASPSDIIYAFSVTVANAIKIIPIDKKIYDYQ